MVSDAKKTKVKTLTTELSTATGIYFADFAKISAKDFTEIRRKLRTQAVKLTVVKNRLALRVLHKLTRTDFTNFLKGQTALAVTTDDPLTPARIIKGFPQLKVKGAFLEGRVFTKEEFSFLASLPPKEVLTAELWNALVGPVYELIALLSGVMARLIVSLESLASIKEAK